MMASRSSARSKPGLSLIEDEYWYAGPLSERKAEIILAKLGEPGCFLVRDSLLPEADYVLSVNSGKNIWHYDIQVLPSNECIFNKYTFTSLPDAVMFYTENRLGSVFLKEPEEPVVSEAQLKSFGPSIIKSASPGSIKPPRSSPLMSAETSTIPTTLTSSPQTRRLAAPESLRPSSPRTPPTSSTKSHHTSSPQTRKLTAPESIKSQYRMQFVSIDSQANASPQLHHRETELHREVGSDTAANLATLSALPKVSGLSGDGWLETHSGAGSQVSLGSHSPKPQSIQHFVVDLDESAGTSQISSQKSEIDCSYIAPSKAVESVFITSGYMYVAPPSSEFDSISPDRENRDEHKFKGQHSPKGERDEGDAKAEICETQFDSFGAPMTAILDTPSSAESTPVRHTSSSQPPVAIEHVTAENGHEYALPNKSSPNRAKKDNSQEEINKTIKDDTDVSSSRNSSNGNSEPDKMNQLPSVASRRLAFEQQAEINKESDQNFSSKPAKQPPAVPKRVSSIPSLQIKENGHSGGDENVPNEPNPIKLGVASSDPLREENKTEGEAEEMPPPPPMSTHPGLSKKPVIEQDSSDQQQEQDEPAKEENSEPNVELRDASKVRPKPKERQISVIPVKPEVEEDTHTEPSEVTPAPVVEPSAEITPVSNGVPATPQDVTDNGTKNEGIDGVCEQKYHKEKAEDDEVASTSTFGHTASPAKPLLATVMTTSEQAIDEERTVLDDVDPSKKIGAEVSTFKPVPKPRSTHRLSTAINNSSISVSPDETLPPKLSTTTTPAASLPSSPPLTYTPEMKRSSAYYPTPANRENLLRAQSMSVLPTTGSASPRMVIRGEQRQQMPPGFVVFSRSQEAVVGRTATLTSNMMRRTIQVDTGTKKKGSGEKTGTAPSPIAAPMNTKRGPKRRKSLFRRK